MQTGIVLLSNAASTGSGVAFPGGRAALTIIGTLATTTKLQVLGADNSTWADVGTISAAGNSAFDCPPGTYRILLTGGSPSGIYATLCKIPYF